MKLKVLGLAAVASLASTGAWANAAGCSVLGTCKVPEISAVDGAAAIAAVLAVVALVWERSRRSA
ncbi:MAG: hypothetical protein OIF47_15745 [Marinibacterium sp.]|nr:hypothetical protein [Marinibacterium sp.]